LLILASSRSASRSIAATSLADAFRPGDRFGAPRFAAAVDEDNLLAVGMTIGPCGVNNIGAARLA
jgi:hypothetical protein